MEIWKYLIILGVIILLILIGSKVIYEDKYIILTGQISLSNGSGNTAITYPDGCNRNNCVPISVSTDIQGWDSYYSNSGMYMYDVALSNSDITMIVNSADGVGTSRTVNYKIVLMKI